MRLPFTTRRSRDNRNGATLLVTLGILTVLSVLVVAYLVSSRLHRQTAIIDQNRLAARNFMDAGLHLAIRQIEDAFTYPNYTDDSIKKGEFLTPQRLAPINHWFAKHYDETNSLSRKVSYQAPDVLASPTFTNAPTVNLLTPQVLRMVPSALTNGLALSPHSTRPLRSGWIPLEPLPASVPLEMRLKSKPARIAFAVFNCSGFVDANTFLSGPTMRKLPRMCFSQADVTNWVESTEVQTRLQDLDLTHDPENTPFFHLSYDPDPNINPVERDSVNVISNLGVHAFEPASKFNINSLSNNFLSLSGLTSDGSEKSRLIVMPDRWFRNVTGILQSASIDLNHLDSSNGRDAYFGDARKVAWNIVSQMTTSRIPTAFDDAIISQNAHAHRLDYAIEAVPLINEVKLRNIYIEPGEADYSVAIYKIEQELNDKYTLNGNVPKIEWSNIYAFDVELWYPFKPAPVPDHSYLWLNVTTNSPPLFIATRTPYGWLEDYGDQASFGRVLFGRWNTIFTATTNPAPILIDNDIVWSFIQTNTVLLAYINQPEAFDSATNQIEIATEFSYLWATTYTNDLYASTTNQPFSLALWTTTQSFTNQLTQTVLANDFASVSSLLRTPYKNLNWADGNAWAEQFRQHFNKTSASQFGEYDKYPIERDHFKDQDFYSYNNTNTLVYFPYVVTNFAANGIDPESITIRFASLQGEEGNDDETGYEERKAWLRAMVTVSEINLSVLDNVFGIPEPVDEVLLLRNGNEEDGYYFSWDKAGSLSIDEPRDNAWADKWQWLEQDTLGDHNVNEYVAESPFIHCDRPFLSIGDLGHVNTAIFTNIVNQDIQPDTLKNLKHPSGKNVRRDTIDFTTRSGASLLDKFGIDNFKTQTRGLIQANVTHDTVLRYLHSGLSLGWTNWFDPSVNYARIEESEISGLIDNWTNTLLKSDAYAFNWKPDQNGCPGWASYADMLPDLGTNLIVHQNSLINEMASQLPIRKGHPYDYDCAEDILRGLVAKDMISFRQNVFVIIVAVQALSPASTPNRPVVLADQRAAVTVLRDAYTGRWTVFDWTWLTE